MNTIKKVKFVPMPLKGYRFVRAGSLFKEGDKWIAGQYWYPAPIGLPAGKQEGIRRAG